MATLGQQDSKTEPPDITQWVILSMQHLRSCLKKRENSKELGKWPDIPKELNDSVWKETIVAIFEHWDKYWESYIDMRKRYIRFAIVQTANLPTKTSTSKCIGKTYFHRGMLKDPYIVKIKDLWTTLSKDVPFIKSEVIRPDVLSAQQSSTDCLSDWFLAFLQHLQRVLSSDEQEYFVEEHVPKPSLSTEQDICQIFIEILAVWNNLDSGSNVDGNYAQILKYLEAMHLMFADKVPSQKENEMVWRKLDKLAQHFMKQLRKTKKKSPEKVEAAFKSKVCEKIVGVLKDSVNVDAIDPPFESEEYDEEQKKQLTLWFESTKALLKEKVKIKADIDRILKEDQQYKTKIKKLDDEVANLKNTHKGEVQNFKIAMEVVLDDERTTDEWIREDTEKKQAMEQWFNDLHEKISAFKSARSNEKREIKEAENNIRILEKQLYEAKQRDTFKSRLMYSLLTALQAKTMVMSFDLSADLGDFDEDTKNELQKHHEDVKKILKRIARKQEESQRQIEDYKAKLSASEESRDQLLNRLSRMAGAKLKDNNPNITDLSDPNRPLKVAEQFSELYDKEWTNALESLTKAKTEETASIAMLFNTVWKCYQFCSDESERSIEAFLICTDGEWRNMLAAHEHQLLSDTRKSLVNVYIAQIKKKFTKENTFEGDKWKHLAPFVEKSLELCWYMVTQSPPLHMEINFPEGTPLDKNVLKHYTVSGDIIAFVVWPALYLHKDGPLLCKGVAQPHPKPRKVREPKERPSTAKT
ncbi:uncharacterized protein LOC125682416 [Ostrea edulis]|uniref:uncharacterized protein LOC125682416 n=1 Tax=Ostrea edulis TaxID=37623 RepID=UPI0024AFA02F|nr:uncharacterized protein LOC125682416 [Ostrea edulis]